MLPCQTKLLLLLSYDPKTGALAWKLSARRGYKPGHEAGSLRKADGYRHVVIEGVPYKAHRLIWKIMTGHEPPPSIDHADSDKGNNAWSNLRAASSVENGYNRKLQKNNKSGVKGVHWVKEMSKWRACIKVNKKHIHLGLFETVEAATPVITKARQDYHAEFARSA